MQYGYFASAAMRKSSRCAAHLCRGQSVSRALWWKPQDSTQRPLFVDGESKNTFADNVATESCSRTSNCPRSSVSTVKYSGHRETRTARTETWQEETEALLPDIPYVGMPLTMPMEFRILQQNRHILHVIPAMGAEAVDQWTNARYSVRSIVIVVQQTSGGLLNFVPHLHVMVSAGD